MSASKYDAEKPDLSLIPKSFLDQVAKVMMLGEKKYGRYNYCKGHSVSQLIAAGMRHMTQLMEGQDVDEESGQSHAAHAACCMLMLLEQERLGTLKDNRFKSESLQQDEKKNWTNPGYFSTLDSVVSPPPSVPVEEMTNETDYIQTYYGSGQLTWGNKK